MVPSPERPNRACDACHRRRIHCDKALPNCDWCHHHGLCCTFDRVRRSTKRRVGATESVYQQISAEVAEVSPTASASGQSTAPLLSSASSSTWPSIDSSLGYQSSREPSPPLPPTPAPAPSSPSSVFSSGQWQDWFRSNSPFFSAEGREWIRNRTGESHVLDISLPWQTEPHRQQHLPLDQQDRFGAAERAITSDCMPQKSMVGEYLELFRSTSFRLVFPIVDAVLMQETIDRAYEEPPSTSAKACVLSFLSIMLHTQWSLKTVVNNTSLDGEACALQAELLTRLIPLETNLVGLQTCFMQSMYHLFAGNLQAAAMHHSLACRILFMLGGHMTMRRNDSMDATNNIHRRTRAHVRKLFWLCYTFDKVIALRTGQPPCIDDEHCDLTLPPGYVEALYSEGEFDAAPATTLCFFPGDFRLSIIKSKTIKLLYSARAQAKSDGELLRHVRELDEELEEWRKSIPPAYRPTLSSQHENMNGFDPAMDSTQKMHIIVIHLEYRHLMATIHWATATGRFCCGKDNALKRVGVSSSQAVSVEASRSSLAYLGAAAHALLGPTFWIIAFYPMCAIVTLFCNILLDPLDSQAVHDIHLLESVHDVLSWLRSRQHLPVNQTSDMVHVEHFVAQVIRLGRCAIVKRRSEEGLNGNDL